jgi:preprotein translocase subunit SecA
MSIFKAFFKETYEAKSADIVSLANLVAQFEPNLKNLSDIELKAKTLEFKDRLTGGESLDDILPEAFAVVRETANRTLKQRHFDVQLLGGKVLHDGGIAEMRTGEGKTLVATLPAYLNALTGKGVHVVTVNDYLARRDAVWMGQIYAALGLSIGVVNNQTSYLYDPAHTDQDKLRDEAGSYKIVYEFLRPVSRREAYAADITYGTNNEFGFDYLRDNIAYRPEQVVGRRDEATGRYHFAIIDEVDSILIDESRTPLIISAPVGESESLYRTFATLAAKLTPETDYTIDEKLKAITLTEAGIDKAEKLLGVENIYTDKGIKYVHHLETAVRARALFNLDKEYVVRNGEVVIVDEFTGRLQPGRRWSEGLHQAIEAKEGVKIQDESRTFATITLQNYFRLYEKLSGMTGTAVTSEEEFRKVYDLGTTVVPSNKPSARKDLSDLIFQTETGKFKAITKRVKELQEKGQPVLIGTVSIEKNELLSTYFRQAGVKHEVLNAKNHEQEGTVVAAAGSKGAVTIATNMAGRGVDIKLGGPQASEAEAEEIKKLGGLCVIGTERHEARRIDNQLRGRSGRQGDAGETRFYLSLEDTLMRIFAPERVKGLMGRLGIPEDEPIENRLVSKAIESAQEKIEGLNFDARKHLLEYDDVTNHQRLSIYDRRRKILFGGLTEVEQFMDAAFLAVHFESEEEQNKLKMAIEARRQDLGGETFATSARDLILQVIDMYWVEHLEALDYMRGSVRLRAYGQRDPLVEYKREGLRLFKELEFSIYTGVLKLLPNLGQNLKREETAVQEIHEGADAAGDKAKAITAHADASAEPKVGRNDICPCGSGKKYKKCHGQ